MKILLIAAALSGALLSGAKAADITAIPTLNVVNIQGEIIDGDALRVAAAGQQLTTARTVTFILNSPGGLVDEAMKIDAVIEYWAHHDNALVNTFVGATDICASSCVLIFADGQNRMVETGGRLAVHSFMDGAGAETVFAQQKTLIMARTLRAAKAPASVIGKFVSTPASAATWLDDADLRAWNVFILPTEGPGVALRKVANLVPTGMPPASN
jgi:hypothetical protein